MAKKEKKQRAAKTDAAFAGEGGGKKGGGFLFAAVSLLSAILVIGAVLAGFLFMVVKMNVMGVADTYRDSLEKIPVLNLALEKEDGAAAPEDMTFEELLASYDTATAENERLTQEVGDVMARNEELSKAKSEFDAQTLVNAEKTAQLENQVATLEAEKKQLEDMKYDLDRIVASGDKEGFAAYFEQVSPEVAQEIYNQIMQERKTDEEKAELLKIFATLDTGAAAAILEELGAERLDLITETLRELKTDISAGIIAELSPALAAQVTLRMSGN